MYTVSVKVAPSSIEGKGVFAKELISKDTIVWAFKNGYDITMSQEQFDRMSEKHKAAIQKTGYLSPWSGLWVFPPHDDPAQYTNHSTNNNLSVKYDPRVSAEPYFVANRNITKGEELTNNYLEFDKISQETKPEWVK